MSFLSEDERIKERMYYFGYQAFWITFWLLMTSGLILGGFLDKKMIEWFFMPSIAIAGLLFFVIRTSWDGIDLLGFRYGIGRSLKKPVPMLFLICVFMFFYDPEYHKHPFRVLCKTIIIGLIVVGFFYLPGKFIDWRSKKVLGSEKNDPES